MNLTYGAGASSENTFWPAEEPAFSNLPDNEGRCAEARALNSLADRLETASKAPKGFFSGGNGDLEEALRDNSRLWGLFYNKAIETPGEPKPLLSQNILKLANFVFKKCYTALSQQKSTDITVLVQINRDIAKGLLQKSF